MGSFADDCASGTWSVGFSRASYFYGVTFQTALSIETVSRPRMESEPLVRCMKAQYRRGCKKKEH